VASFVYNIFKQRLALGTTIWNAAPASGDTMKIALTETVLSDPDPDNVTAALTGGAEYDGSYSRTQVSGQSVTLNDTNDRAELDASDTTVSAVGADGTDKVEGVLLYHDVDGTDGNAVPIAFFDLATGFYGNGSDVTFTWDSTGLITLT